MRNFLIFCFLMLLISSVFAQQKPLSYYLPAVEYDKTIPTPEQVLGWQIGENHISHDQLVFYMRVLAKASPRVTIQEVGRTYESRPLLLLTIASAKNQSNIDRIRAEHIALSNPNKSATVKDDMPAVVYAGYTVHGNESSGVNAAPLVAYHLAAAQDKKTLDLLENVVILLDPCLNPDGTHRFSTWVNSNKGNTLVSDVQSRELNEPWPGGRTNHYLFDLNRDWLPVQHPSSQARIKAFHDWKPNVLTDHHEMGSNATFFFQPGVPQRTNPLTPQENQDLTYKISQFHIKALDKIGSLYFSKENYDDYYYGKGSTYPDVNGAVGILFEQASSRGHAHDTEHGVLEFAFTIRNQVKTSFSTFEAAANMKKDLLQYQQNFYKNALKEAAQSKTKAYVVSAGKDQARLYRFAEMLQRHQIDLYKSNKDISQKGKTYKKEESLIVPMEQMQYRLLRAMFENVTTFKDSLFYDVSAWTLPLAFDLDYAGLTGSVFKGEKVVLKDLRQNELPVYSEYAYLMSYEDYYAPKALNYLQQNDVLTEVATNPFMDFDGETHERGTILIPVQEQQKTSAELHEMMTKIVRMTGVKVKGMTGGEMKQGGYLGSNSFASLDAVNVAIVTGKGSRSYDVGEAWHLLDYRMKMQTSLLETSAMSWADLTKYNVIVMADGRYNSISEKGGERLKKWVQNGGTLIAMKGAAAWAKKQGICNYTSKTIAAKENTGLRPYEMLGRDRGAEVIGGAIVGTKVDLTHPLNYGLSDEELPFFRRGKHFWQVTSNQYATPVVYNENPLISGYISKKNQENLSNAAAVIVSGTGRGKVICLADNPNFRAFWYGTNRIFLNAVFFSPIISNNAVQR